LSFVRTNLALKTTEADLALARDSTVQFALVVSLYSGAAVTAVHALALIRHLPVVFLCQSFNYM